MSANPRIGIVGAGLMGHGIAKNLVEKGFPLVVRGHRNRAPIDDLVKRGANMSAKNRNGQTALMLSIGYNQNAMTLTRPAITALLRKLGATE